VQVLSIGRKHIGSQVIDEDSGGGDGGEYRRSSGERCAGLEGQWMGREASQG
jgi:hypothetical protein